ncbi:MAG TPA: hypothetical protein VHF22_10335 [Planctomycetota bacterium]|nr:hypothetical protein [Planctomycetota bacterium]
MTPNPKPDAPRARRRARLEAGLTLVELMIAIALMLIMTLQLQIIFGHSRKLYLGADALAQVYSNVRTALDQIEKDVTNAVKTDQMEFFDDNKTAATGIGHFNIGEENRFVSKQTDLVPGHYIHSFLVKQEEDYTPKDSVKVGGPYRHDGIYFRTLTNLGGVPREALVQYQLFIGVTGGKGSTGGLRERPILQRRLVAPKVDKTTGVPLYDGKGNPIYERGDWQDICYYVQEFKVELYIRDEIYPGRIGKFYSPKDLAVQRLGQQSPATADEQFPPSLVNLLAGKNYAVECLVGGDDVDDKCHLRKDGPLATARLHIGNGDKLLQLARGAKLYIRAEDGWDNNGLYGTVKKVTPPSAAGGETMIDFEEGSAIAAAMSGATDKTVAYRAGWLPQAIRITMKIKDQRSSEIRTVSRIFRLLRA